jgi:hypothetical protein
MTALPVAAFLIAYLVAGAHYGTLNFARREFARNLDRYPSLYREASQRRQLRRECLGGGLPVALIWPVYLVWLAVASRADTFIPETDVEAAERIAAQERRIAELEAELLRRSA